MGGGEPCDTKSWKHRGCFRQIFGPALLDLTCCNFVELIATTWSFWSMCCHNVWMTNRFLYRCDMQCGPSTMGSPFHLSRNFCNHLDVTFSQQWIGCGCPVHCPAWSLSYYAFILFWDHIKTLVYTQVNSAEELVERIAVAARKERDMTRIFLNIRDFKRCRF